MLSNISLSILSAVPATSFSLLVTSYNNDVLSQTALSLFLPKLCLSRRSFPRANPFYHLHLRWVELPGSAIILLNGILPKSILYLCPSYCGINTCLKSSFFPKQSPCLFFAIPHCFPSYSIDDQFTSSLRMDGPSRPLILLAS